MLEGFTRALRLWRRKSAYMSTIVQFPSFHNCRNTFYSYSKPLEGMGNVADSRNEGQQVSWNTHVSFKSMNGVIPDESHGYSELALPCPLFLPSPKWPLFKLNMRLFYAGLLKRQRGGQGDVRCRNCMKPEFSLWKLFIVVWILLLLRWMHWRGMNMSGETCRMM